MDHSSVSIQQSSISYGVLALSNITKDYDKVLHQLASYLYHPRRGQPAALVIWSDTDTELYNHIANKRWVNETMVSMPVENPKTGNNISVFVWAIPHEQLKAWYKQRKIDGIKRQ